MSVPVVTENANSTIGYFPENSGWYDFFDGKYVIGKKDSDRSV
jgi:alpha-glucosidase (family GH31 glycosyl hydrolase)